MGSANHECGHKPNRCTWIGLPNMKAWLVGSVVVFLSLLLLLRCKLLEGPLVQSSLYVITDQSSEALHVDSEDLRQSTERTEKFDQIVPSPLFRVAKNLPSSEAMAVSVWRYLKPVFSRADLFPDAKQGLKEAEIAWQGLMEDKRLEALDKGNKSEAMNKGNISLKMKAEKHCPNSVSSVNSSELQRSEFLLPIPCGLILDSSITVVGVPEGAEGDFAIEFLGPKLPGESFPSIILHYNVRLQGDEITDDAVIVQNTLATDLGWAEEQRCPAPDQEDNETKVDGLEKCNKQVGKVGGRKTIEGQHATSSKWLSTLVTSSEKPWFPFVSGIPFAATMWVGWEGFHMTVNGKHITSFEYRENLEPSSVNHVRLKGNLKPVSVMANGLPASEDVSQIVDLEFLKAPPFSVKKTSDLFIGVFSTANNFDRRMALRRSWMQYEAVRSGQVTVRIFVGLHSNKQVNKELWKEALTYGDIQLLPFVDYYNLITLKTIAICIFGTKMVTSNYIMKTDDDTFVRVDEVLTVLNKTGHSRGLLCGSIEFDAKPHRDPDNKWYISNGEWPHLEYPPWAHGPGYVISRDIAKFVVRSHEEKTLKLFKLEDVSMGIWIEQFKQQGNAVYYNNDVRFFNTGCFEGYVTAHYQNPKRMFCLWQKLKKSSEPICCD